MDIIDEKTNQIKPTVDNHPLYIYTQKKKKYIKSKASPIATPNKANPKHDLESAMV